MLFYAAFNVQFATGKHYRLIIGVLKGVDSEICFPLTANFVNLLGALKEKTPLTTILKFIISLRPLFRGRGRGSEIK